MKYWIGIHVISNNQGILNAIEKVIPTKVDNRLWQTSQFEAIQSIDIDGNNCFHASLFFNDIADRENFNTVLRGINGMINSAMSGSYIKMSKCWHDETVNGLCSKLDQLTFEEIV